MVAASHSAHYGLRPGDAQQEGIKVGGQLREHDDRTGNRAEHVLNQGAHIRNWPDHIRNRRHRIRNRRDLVRNRVDRLRNRGTAVRVVFCPVLGVRAARLVVRLFRSGGMLLVWLATRAKRAILGVRAARLVLQLFRAGGILLA